MDRLTYRPDNGLEEIVYLNPADPEGSYDILDLAKYADAGDGMEAQVLLKISDRLFAYEDTGLTPEEVEAVKIFCSNDNKMYENLIHENAQLRAELEQVKAERDAAVKDLKGMCEVLNSCAFCIHDLRGTNENWPTIHCNNKDKRKCWIWRGFKAGDPE